MKTVFFDKRTDLPLTITWKLQDLDLLYMSVARACTVTYLPMSNEEILEGVKVTLIPTPEAITRSLLKGTPAALCG